MACRLSSRRHASSGLLSDSRSKSNSTLLCWAGRDGLLRSTTRLEESDEKMPSREWGHFLKAVYPRRRAGTTDEVCRGLGQDEGAKRLSRKDRPRPTPGNREILVAR